TSPGLHTVTFTVHSSAPDASISLSVTGTQTGAAMLAVSDAPTYNFGTVGVGTTLSHTFALTNSGSTAASAVSAPPRPGPFSLDASSTGGATLAGGASCDLVVKFAPTVGGAANGQLEIAYNDGTANQTATRAMTGSGRAPASLTLSDGATFDFTS